jgi:hypothetical protein
LLQGIVAGRQLRMQMQREMQQQQAAQQEMTARDIQQRMLIAQNTRPVDEAGLVTERPGQGPQQNADLPGMPGSGAVLGPNNSTAMGPVLRKARAADTFSYRGEKREIMTPDEQAARRALEARMTGIQLDPNSPAMKAIGATGPVYIQPNEIGSALQGSWRYQPVDQNAIGGQAPPAAPAVAPERLEVAQAPDTLTLPDGTPIPAPPNFAQNTANAMVGPAPAQTIPMGALPAVVRLRTNAATNTTRQNVADTIQAGANGRAALNSDTRIEAADTSQAGANARNAATNKTRMAATAAAQAGANQRATARVAANTPAAVAVQTRFDAKRMDALAKDEQSYKNEQASLAGMLNKGIDQNGAPLTEGRKTLMQAQLRTAVSNLQNAQFRKANVMKAPLPSDAAQKAMPEGGDGDLGGHTWHKQDGVVYLVK